MAKPVTTLIKGGIVVLGPAVSVQDVLIEGERIGAVGRLSGAAADVEIDATDLLVLPGAIDAHVHFDDVFMGTVSVHNYYTGTLAAAFGGVTSVIDFSNQIPGEPLIKTLEVKKEAARDQALVDWGVHAVITDAAAEILEEIALLVDAGVPTIKCYMTYKQDGLMMEADKLRHILRRLREAEDSRLLRS